MNINTVFLDRMKSLLKEDYEDFCLALNKPMQKSVFVNENKISVESFKKLADFEIEPIPYEKAGFYVDNVKKGRHILHHAGAFYVQEPSSMFTVNAIKFKGDEKVLDLCAAPGGKTIQIANRIPNGVLVSNEFNKARSEILFSNVERMGLKNVIIANDSPKNIASSYGNSFDVVFVDAPCSGEGMLRRGEAVANEWYPEINEMCAKRQKEILSYADKTLKENGILVYSTCTYSVLENEEVVSDFLKTHNYELVNIDYPFTRGVNMSQAVRLYPHKVRGEGQFVAVLKKKEENLNFSASGLKLTNSKISKDFISKYFITTYDVVEYKNYSYICPQKDMVKKYVNYVSIGVRIGQVIKNRFEPHHNLFTAFGCESKIKLELNLKDVKVEKYLRGEIFDVDLSDGYGAILVENCALGGFKVSKGQFKNYYPKGLRNF